MILLLAREGELLQEDAGPPVVGVLPFTELGATEDHTYFGDGLADTLTYKLGQLQQLIVLAPTSTFQFRGSDQDLLAVGAKLGATALLQGTVRRVGETLQVNARLVDTASGQQLWSGSYDRQGADLFAVQDEIAQSVTEALHMVLSPEEGERLVKLQTGNLTAYDAYLRGRAALARRTSASTLQAVEDFRRATQLDPKFALGYSALVEALYLSTHYSIDTTSWGERAAEAQAAAGQAQALEPGSGEAWLAQAFAAMGDNQFGDGTAWPQEHIAALLKKAVELSPNNAVALKFYADYLATREEQLAALERAAQLDPRSAIIWHNIAEHYQDLGRYEEALRYYLESAVATGSHFGMAYAAIVEMYGKAGRFNEAARWGRAYYRAHPEEADAFGSYSAALNRLGAWDEQKDLVDKVVLPQSADTHWRLAKLWANVVPGLGTRDCPRVIEAIDSFGDPFPAAGEPWPDARKMRSGEAAVATRALCEWIEGRPESALSMLQAGIPDWDRLRVNSSNHGFHTPVLASALLKATGRTEEANQILMAFLEQARDLPAAGDGGIGFGRFFALAVAGQTRQALDELEGAIDSGWTSRWWSLDLLDADPDFAAVTADPRFREITGRLHDRIAAMRESYFANPELPEGYSIP